MVDLVLHSSHHQRYENGVPVMGAQFCNRTIKIENKVFKELFNGLDVTPKEGFLVTMWNMDLQTPMQQMHPKLMGMKADTGDKILLCGVTLKAMGNTVINYGDYGITLHLKNRNVVKCVLHMYDRSIDIEYDDLVDRFY